MGLIEIVGSSTPNGFGDAGGGQAARTRIEVHARRENGGMVHEINDWTSAAQTTESTLRRVNFSAAERVNYALGRVTVGYLGPYDSCINLAAGLDAAGQPQTMVPEDVFASNVEEICRSAIGSGSHVRLVGLPPLADEHALIGKKERYDERYRAHFEQIQWDVVKSIAADLRRDPENTLTIGFMPVYSRCIRVMSIMRDVVDRDMVHPATVIHALMWQLVMKEEVLPLADSIDTGIRAQRKVDKANAAAEAAALAAGGVIIAA